MNTSEEQSISHVGVLTDTIWTPVTRTASLHLQLSVALEGAAADGQLHAGSLDVVPAGQTKKKLSALLSGLL